MLFGNRQLRKFDAARRRQHDAYRPRGERLETKILLSIDLGTTAAPPSLPSIANAPYGMDFAGDTSAGAAGTSVADVGSLTNNGYEDVAIGAPGGNSSVSVVFGSATGTTAAIENWIGINPSTGTYYYTPNDRVGNLGQIGTASQTNPITGTALDFPFSGMTFVTSSDPSSGLGTSVAGVQLTSGASALIIGAPDYGDGRVYVISGTWSTYIGDTINLDDPAAYPGLSIVTYEGSNSDAELGESVAGGFNILGDGFGDIIMGAPNATLGATTTTPPTAAETGAAYVVSTALLPSGSPTTPILVNTLGQSGTQSVILGGVGASNEAGFSVADAGDVNGASGSVDDLLIGAPDAGTGGAAYLVYGGNNLGNLATTVTFSNGSTLRWILLSNVGATTGTIVPGATINAPTSTGSSNDFGSVVASAGDFNSSGYADIMIGSPDYSSSSTLLNQGEVTLLYGAPSSSSGYLTGTINLTAPPTNIVPLYLQGADAGDKAGTSISLTGVINSGQPNPILIGAPDYDYNGVADAGTAYLIPGVSGLTGTVLLNAASLEADQFVLSSSATTGTEFGSSVSGILQNSSYTVDEDSIGDFIIGAPGYVANSPTLPAGAGGAMVVEGGLITLAIPTPTPTPTPTPPTPTPTPTPTPSPAPTRLAGLPKGPTLSTTYVSPFGATQYTPTVAALSAVDYAPLPLSVAMQEYQPTLGFAERMYANNHPGKHLPNYTTIRGPAATGLYGAKQPRNLIPQGVYNRSRFHVGKSYEYTHKAPKTGSIYTGVVPIQETRQNVADTPGPVYKDSYRDIGSKGAPTDAGLDTATR